MSRFPGINGSGGNGIGDKGGENNNGGDRGGSLWGLARANLGSLGSAAKALGQRAALSALEMINVLSEIDS